MDPGDNPGGGPGQALPPQPQAVDHTVMLAKAIANLANISAMGLANNLSKAKAVQKPSPFKGEQGSDARWFLVAYTMWAMTQGTALNVVDQQGNPVDRKETEWIRAALSYLQDDASIWASPSMKEFADGGAPFDGQWDTFRRQFKARFETIDKVIDAKEKLRILWQGGSTVPEYAALFKESMARTGYSSMDLRDRFYDHLSVRVKDELVHTARPIDTLDRLVVVASDLDVRMCQRQAEKEQEKRRAGVSTEAVTAPTVCPSVPFIPPAAPSNAMEVDATHTREEFVCRMRGKCFGCGSIAHNKRDGNHEHKVCTYCRHVGIRKCGIAKSVQVSMSYSNSW